MSGRDRDKYRSHPSGHEKRLKKQAAEENLKKMKGSFLKYIEKTLPKNLEDNNTNTTSITMENIQLQSPTLQNITVLDKQQEYFGISEVQTISSTTESNINFCLEDDETNRLDTNILCENRKFSMVDPATWTDDNMTQPIRTEVVKFGPYQVKDFDFPYSDIDGTKRKFSTFYYTRKLENCEIVKRTWLIYSKSCDRVFCFCCKLFTFSGPQQSLLSTIGTNNWKCLSENLKSHEHSSLHLKAVQTWIELKLRISENSTIVRAHQSAMEKEKQHWKNVMIRIIAAIQYLAKHHDAFRGSSDLVNTENNGKFIGIIEMMGKFDPTIMEHLRRIKNKETRIHYLSHDIQNELIELMATEVKKNILQKIKLAKYYAIIMDCTPDISKHEQLSLVIRIVDMNSENDGTDPEIKEYFMDFVNVISGTGLNLSEVLLQKLAEYQIHVGNCRAQCYDNGANMAGQYKGVQARLLNQNPRAFFMPCAAHRLNLVIGDAVKSSTRAIHFFGTIERIYTIFAASAGRWIIFTKHCHRWTVKRWSETRWESRHDSIKSIRFQVKEIIEALDEVAETTNDSLIKSETHSLVSEIGTYEFLISLCVWYTVLQEVNIISKSIQGPNTNLDTYATLLNALIKFMDEYRETGFNQAKLEAKELAETLEIKTEFKVPRYRKKKKLFEYEGNTNYTTDPENDFRCSYFLELMDNAIQSIKKRFDQTSYYNNIFGFLYKIGNLRTSTQEDIRRHCKDLAMFLKVGDEKDVSECDLFDEIVICRNIVDESETPLEVLRTLKKCNGAFPNLSVAIRIMLTIPITSAGAERSFSKLKLIKNYLRSSISQDRLSGLATLAIEKELAENLSYENIIEQFATKKSRKINFK